MTPWEPLTPLVWGEKFPLLRAALHCSEVLYFSFCPDEKSELMLEAYVKLELQKDRVGMMRRHLTAGAETLDIPGNKTQNPFPHYLQYFIQLNVISSCLQLHIDQMYVEGPEGQNFQGRLETSNHRHCCCGDHDRHGHYVDHLQHHADSALRNIT